MKDIREPYRTLLAAGVVGIWLCAYLVINHAHLDRHTIPFLPGEMDIPYLPWTYILYWSAFAQALIVLRALPRHLLLPAGILASAIGLISFVFFIVFPIMYPRELYGHESLLVELFRTIDGPGNCFPSLHVAGTILLAGVYQRITSSRATIISMWIWSFVIALSVLTTKQHYIIDVFGGGILAFTALWFFFRNTARIS